MTDCVILVQARMSSSRFPGKVLAPLCGRPVIAHVIDRVRMVAEASNVILVTSREESDDPLAIYAETCLGINVFRGDLKNVLRRFQAYLESSPYEWFVRICGDSPVIDHELISFMLEQTGKDFDLITNVMTRTFPAGQSVEVVRTSTFLDLGAMALETGEQEHVTLHYYRHPDQYRIRSVISSDASLAQRRLVVDSVADMEALGDMLANNPELTTGYARFAEVAL